MPKRTLLFGTEPIGELRGLATLTDPDDEVAAVIDLPVIGAPGDGKSQFIIHAIRALHAHAPALEGPELHLNRDVMRLVLDPRATRPDATPPGVVPHFTFRVRAAGLYARLGRLGALRMGWRAAGMHATTVLAALLVLGGLAIGVAASGPGGLLIVAIGALLAASVALIVRGRLARTGDVEIVFWDIAGEQIYSAAAADYYALLSRLVEARRRRAEQLGRTYALAPVLICNPLALGTAETGSRYERLRQLLPLFGALDGDAVRTLVAINRWSIVDPICARGAQRDEIVSVTARSHDAPAGPTSHVSREQVREHCLDAEDGRDGNVRVTYLRYDTAIRSTIEAKADPATLTYDYDDGPGAFSGDAHHRFLEWIGDLVKWPRTHQPAGAGERTVPAEEPLPEPRVSAVDPVPGAAQQVWSRPMDPSRPA